MIALALTACDRGPKPFRMEVQDVQSMRGFVLNGLGVRGTVEQGCIANFDAFVFMRDGKIALESAASIMSVDGLAGSEAKAGDEVMFFLKDAPDGAVAVGDVIEAETNTCSKEDSEAEAK